MTWQTNLSRIRRFLRDPDGNIWQDSIIRNAFNDSQKDLQKKTNVIVEIAPVRVPPRYHFSYLQDWEWPFLSSETGNYQALRFHQQGEMCFCFRWEAQSIWGLIDATASDKGAHCTHPFEFFMGGSIGDIIPLQFPSGFHNCKFAWWDRDPIDFLTRKELQKDDDSWMTRSGEPIAYWRPDMLEDQFCLYPVPSSIVWDDNDPSEEGQILYGDDDTLNSEYGLIIDESGSLTMPGDNGIATDIVSPDDNALFVFSKVPEDMIDATDEPDYPDYLQKYVEYGALEQLYAADTDGQIQSLRDYWKMRYDIGVKAVTQFMSFRYRDRDYRLTTRGVPRARTRRQPSLPDHYPAVS